MKNYDLKTFVFSFALMLFALSACGQKQDFEKLANKEVGATTVDAGQKFIDGFYDALGNGTTYSFTAANATSEVKNTFYC